ncbi:ZIP zinc transporter family protein [Streptococcus thermophilus]|nr:ZIP zinc transporter family protein [Streptococcus thermophilus]
MVFTSKCCFLSFSCWSLYLGCTIVSSAIVFFFKNISRKLQDIMMGFAAGVMIAASFWSATGSFFGLC